MVWYLGLVASGPELWNWKLGVKEKRGNHGFLSRLKQNDTSFCWSEYVL